MSVKVHDFGRRVRRPMCVFFVAEVTRMLHSVLQVVVSSLQLSQLHSQTVHQLYNVNRVLNKAEFSQKSIVTVVELTNSAPEMINHGFCSRDEFSQLTTSLFWIPFLQSRSSQTGPNHEGKKNNRSSTHCVSSLVGLRRKSKVRGV